MNAKAKQVIPVVSDDRSRMLAQIDELEANGAPATEVAELRAGVRALRLPADLVTPAPLTHADAIVGAAQLRTLVKLWADRMPTEVAHLLLRIATSLAGAK